ncbi:MAG TPA: insulinase family protein, partial [Clostridiales bacterium]|nr:insulinase family protein [Clostridiales bacterium]
MTRFDYPELDETMYRQKLSSALTVCVVPRKGFTRSLAYFVTDYGSVHTRYRFGGKDYRSPAGVAHYLEHKMFDLP